MKIQVTKTKVIHTGNEIDHNGKVWKIYTDEQQYGKETRLTQKQVDKLEKEGSIKRVSLARNLACYQAFLYKYIVK